MVWRKTGNHGFLRSEIATGMIGAAAVIGFVAVQIHHVIETRQDSINAIEVQAETLARNLAEGVRLSLRSVTVALQDMAEEFGETPALEPRQIDRLRRHYKAIDVRIPGLTAFDYIDAYGILNFNTHDPGLAGTDFSDRRYFTYHKETVDQGFFVAPPIIGRVIGRQVLPVSIGIRSETNEFQGIIVSGLTARFFDDFFSRIELGPQDFLAVYHEDGTFLARRPDLPGFVGSSLASLPYFKKISAATNGVFRLASPGDGIDRFFAFRRIDGAPLIAVVALSADVALGPWLKDAWQEGFVAALLAGLGFTFVATTMAAIRKRRVSESRVLENQRRTLDFAESASDWFWEMGPDLRLIWVSGRFEAVTKIPSEQILGKTRAELATGDADRESALRHARTLERHESFKDFEYRLTRGDGAIRTISVSGRPIFGDDGAFAGYRGIGRDVTNDIKSRQRLERLKWRLDAAIESVPGGFVIEDHSGKIVLCNKPFREFYGLSDEFVGADIQSVLPPTLQHQSDNGGRALGMRQGQLADGRWIRVIERPTALGGVVGIHLDITEEVFDAKRIKDQSDLILTILASINDGMIAVDGNGRVVAVNDRYNELLEIPKSVAFPGAGGGDITRYQIEKGEFGKVDDVESFVRSRFSGVLTHARRTEERHRRNGRVVFIRRSALLTGGVVSVISDITDIKRREAEIVENARLLKATLSNVGEGIAVFDRELKLVLGNRLFSELLGLPEKFSERGTPLAEILLHQAEQGEFGDGDPEQLARKMLSDVRPQEARIWDRQRPNGKWLHLHRTPMPDGGFVTIYSDITEAKSREQTIAESADLIRTSIENMDEGILAFDGGNRLSLFNQTALSVMGLEGHLVKAGIGIRDIQALRQRSVGADEKDEVIGGVAGILERSINTPFKKVGRDGQIVEFRPRPMVGGGHVIMVADRTAAYIAESHQRELEKQLRQSEKLRAIGTLASGVAHDFNNILVPILALAELSADDVPENTLLRRNLDNIARAARRARDVVARLLSFARQSGDGGDKERVDLCKTVVEAVSLLRAGLPSSIAIRSPDLEAEGDCCDVEANPADIVGAVMNLVTNAAHAIGEKQGRVDISVQNARIAAETLVRSGPLHPGDYAVLSISDNGNGMSAETMDRMFDPFFTTKAVGEGTGLGLSSVLGMVRGMDGQIDVESEVGKGTHFRLYFPRADDQWAASP